jgi:hypothetical protein
MLNRIVMTETGAERVVHHVYFRERGSFEYR